MMEGKDNERREALKAGVKEKRRQGGGGTLLGDLHSCSRSRHRHVTSLDIPGGGSSCLCVGWHCFGFGFTALHF